MNHPCQRIVRPESTIPNGAIRSQSQVAAMRGVTKRAIRDLEKRAFRKLRNGLLADPEFIQLAQQCGWRVA